MPENGTKPDYRNLFMARTKDVPELLEQFMEESGERKRWVTVNEFRTYFGLDEFSAPAISGFLRRIYYGQFLSCPYRVERIEKVTVKKKQRRVVKRYLVTRRPRIRNQDPALQKNSFVTGGLQVPEKDKTALKPQIWENSNSTGNICQVIPEAD